MLMVFLRTIFDLINSVRLVSVVNDSKSYVYYL